MVSSSGYVAGEEGAGGGYRLDNFEAVFKGRMRELLRTAVFVGGLIAAQFPLRQVAQGRWASGLAISVEVPGRLSLILDAALIFTYLFLAYRTFGLVRSFRPSKWVLRANMLGLTFVLAGAAADAWENVQLWERLGRASVPSPAMLTVRYHNDFGHGPDFVSFSRMMFLLVVVGLLLQTVAGGLAKGAHFATLTSYIGARQRSRHHADGDHNSQPSGGIVVCCSGGGIRSAAFSLGGIQALTDKQIYQRARADVGVSGGGYMGAACHVVRWNPRDHKGRGPGLPWTLLNQGPMPFASTSPEAQWLRRHTRYVLDTLRVAVQGALSLAFGIAVNLLLVTAVIGGTAWILAWLMLASRRLVPWDSAADDPDNVLRTAISSTVTDDWTWLNHVWWIPVAGVAVFLLEKVWDRFVTLPRVGRGMFRSASSWLILGGAGLCALFLGIPWLLVELSEYAARSGSSAAGLIHQLGLVPSAVCDQVLTGSRAACGVTPGPEAGEGNEAAPTSIVTVGGVSLAAVISAILAVLASVKGAAKQDKETTTRFGGIAQNVWKKIKDPIVPWLAVAAIGLVAMIILLRWLAGLVADPALLAEWRYAWWFAGLVAAVKVGTDANRTSLHHFFRERISYAFLVRRGRKRIEPVPYRRPLRFSQAAPRDGGPRLVSCAVANVSDDDVVPSKRGCIPFVFDHTRIGLTDRLLPESAARRASASYEFAADFRYRDATIPAALAMSAAAFSPMVGRENVKIGPYRAVLALANARLGVWLPNPLWMDEGSVVRRLISLGRGDEAASIAFGTPRGQIARASHLHLSDRHWERLEAMHLAQRRTVSEAESPVAIEALRKAEELAEAIFSARTGVGEPPEPPEAVRLATQLARAEKEARTIADQRAAARAGGNDPDLEEGEQAALQLGTALALARSRAHAAARALSNSQVADLREEALKKAGAELVGVVGMLKHRMWALDRPLHGPRKALTPWWSVVAPVGEVIRTIFKKPGLTRLVKEGIGKASVFDRFLYVTDGGHYDNLGLVEALRGRPDLVYVLDASNDPEDTFRTLGRSVATARMDLDCEITMDPRGMRRLKETRSGSAWCHGQFVFADGHRGTIFMAKAIMLDGLSWDIETYSHDNMNFPRTATNNQLYSEFDFEAYRALGQSAVERMLGSIEHLEAAQRPPLSDAL